MDCPGEIKHLYGLIGYPLKHSFSQKYFRQKFKDESITDSDFLNFEILNLDEIHVIITSHPNLKGFSVTIPYKEKILPYLNNIDLRAQEIGAVNAVTCRRIGSKIELKGYNTDYYGFTKALKPYLNGDEKRALVLGTGGASKSVCYALRKLNIESILVSRNSGDITYAQIEPKMLEEVEIIVNTTPLGMWPEIDLFPDIPYHQIKQGTICFDLIYNPEKTKFLELSEKYGAIIVNGMDMLKYQAEKSWFYFNEL